MVRANKALLDINVINYWFKLNKLFVRVENINLNYSQIKVYLRISLNNFELDKVGQTKYLGVINNEKLPWDDPISLVCNKVNKHVAIIRSIKDKALVTLLRSLYHMYYVLINPYFEYCIHILGDFIA